MYYMDSIADLCNKIHIFFPVRSIQKNLSSRIPFSMILLKICYKTHLLRSIEKNTPVRPHFSEKMVSHKQLFLYRPQSHHFPAKNAIKWFQKDSQKQIFLHRPHLHHVHPDAFLRTSGNKKELLRYRQSLICLATAPYFTSNSYIHSFTDL